MARGQPWRSFQVGDSQVVILAGDAEFLSGLVNTVLFALFIVPGLDVISIAQSQDQTHSSVRD